MVTLFLLLALAVFVIYNYRNYAKQFRDIDKLPGPSTFRLVKELWINSSSKGIINYYQTLTKTYGPVVKVWLKPFRPIIVTTDVEYCNRILKSKQHQLSPAVLELTLLGEGFSKNASYDIWKKDRQILTKAINRGYIEGRLRIYDRKFDELLVAIRRNPEEPIDFEEHLHRILLETMIATFQHPHVDVEEEKLHGWMVSRNDFFKLLMQKMNSFRCMGVLHKLTRNYKLISARRDELIRFGRDWVKKFRKVEEGLRDNRNLVYAMMEGGIPDDRIADNLITIIEGGSDTIVFPLAMAFREMGRRPEIQRKLLDEIVDVMGNDATRRVTSVDFDRMPYLHAIAKEAVRRYMPLPFLDRRTPYDTTIGGTNIPKNTRVMFDMPGILTAEENYDDPLDFKPERFLKENATAKGQMAFFGFGYGPKICIGKFVAYATMKLLIVKIVREFEILRLDDDVQLVAEFFFRSLTGIPIAFRKRPTN